MIGSKKWWSVLVSLIVLGLALASCQPAAPSPGEEAEEEMTEGEAAQEAVAEEEEAAAEEDSSEEAATEEEPVRIAVFHPVLGDAYTKSFTDGIEEVAAQLGGTVEVFGSDYDLVVQSNQIQDAIVSGNYDAFIVYANDGNAIVPDVEDAVAAGLVVIGADVVIGPDPRSLEPCCGLTAMIGTPGYTQGKVFGEMIVEACGDKDPCEVAYLIGVQSLSIDQERLQAVEDVLADYPQIEIVAVQEALYLEEEGYNVAQNLLQSNPGIDVFSSSGDEMILGAEQAVIDAGLVGEVALVGNGVSYRGYEAIKEGRFFASYANIPYTQGQLAGEAAIKAVRGEEVERSVDMSTLSPPLPAGSAIITQENVDQFEPQW